MGKIHFNFLASLFFLLALVACGGVNDGNKNQAGDEFVDQEIADRIRKIGELNKELDTLLINTQEVDKRVNELVLLSKDVENLGASVFLANSFFAEMAARYAIPQREFKEVNTRMHANDIASMIRQNEMVLLNQVILRSGNEGILLRTAH